MKTPKPKMSIAFIGKSLGFQLTSSGNTMAKVGTAKRCRGQSFKQYTLF
jgi:hypothetical protein